MTERATGKERALLAVALCLVVCVVYAGPLFGGATFVGRDHLTHTLPAKQVIANAISSGHLPEWWSEVDLGVPLAANPNHSALYPPTWLVGVLPMPWSADFLLILHVLWVGLGAAALSRRLGANHYGAALAGIAFMLGGFTTSTVVHGGPLLTLAWMPWIAWAADRLAAASDAHDRWRKASLLACVLGAQLLAGDPSVVIMSWWLAIAFVMLRSTARRAVLLPLGSACLAALVLAAAVLVPAFALARSSTRAGGVSGPMADAWAMHPLRIVEWIWPHALGDANQPADHLSRIIANAAGKTDLSPGWALSLYISLPVLALACVGLVRAPRSAKRLGWIMAVFVLLALGRYTPIYGAYRAVFLPEHFVRYPEKYIAVTMLLACAFAGVGWTSLVERLPSRPGLVAITSGLIVFVGAILTIAIARDRLAEALTRSGRDLAPPVEVGRALERALDGGWSAVVVCVLLVTAVALSRRKPFARWMQPLGLAVLAGHLAAVTWTTLPLFDRSVVDKAPSVVRGVKKGSRIYRSMRSFVGDRESVPDRALAFYASAAPNTAARFEIGYLRGYDQAEDGSFDTAWSTYMAPAGDRSLDLFAVDYRVVPSPDRDPPYVLQPNEGARPRAFVAHRWRWFPTQDDALADLFPRGRVDADADALQTIRLVGHGVDQLTGPELTSCTVTSERPEDVRLICDSAAGYVTLLDTWASGWTAEVDGKPAPIERADALARAVRVDAGRHVIELRYCTPGLRLGAIVSGIAWLAMLASIIVLRRMRDEAGSGSE